MKPTVASVLWLPFAAGIFLLPGWALSRRVGGTLRLVTSFLGSAAILLNLILLLDAVGIPIRAPAVGLGLLLVAAVILKWPGGTPAPAPAAPAAAAGSARAEWIWLIAPVVALGTIATRAIADPLSGYDNPFRWEYLARLILARESLGGYPPVSAVDFQAYAWCDGIPPLIPVLNYWIYAVTGCSAPVLTAARVIAEAVMVGLVVYRGAESLWGEGAGRPALAAMSSSALAAWSIAMGQETGLTALSLGSMIFFLERQVHARRPADLFWAAVAAGVGAITRDYALAFPLLGLALLAWRRGSRRELLQFAGVAGAICAPWYLRNWITTGNPLYPHRLGGLFGGNPIHEETMRQIAKSWSLRQTPYDVWIIPAALAVLVGILAAVAAVGALRGRKRTMALIAACAVVTTLWLLSIAETAGGWIYSMRVLLPAAVTLAMLAGWIAHTGTWTKTLLAVLFTLGAADAARRSWLLPANALTPPWPYSFAGWRDARELQQRINSNRVWQILAREAGQAGIVVDHPSYHSLVLTSCATPVPLFSPQVRPLFDDNAALEATLARLRADNIRFLVVTQGSPIGEALIREHRFGRGLLDRVQPASVVGHLIIYDLQHLAAKAP